MAKLLELSFASGEKSLSVRGFSIQEGISSLFQISIWALSKVQDIDLEAIVGKAAKVHVVSTMHTGTRVWTGVCSYMEQVSTEPTGGATYALNVAPDMWRMTHRRNYRIFQHLAIPDIIDRVLAEWGITAAWNVDRGRYLKLEYKVQYGESDYSFVTRLLEEAGIAFTFPEAGEAGSKLTFSDNFVGGTLHRESPIEFADEPNPEVEKAYLTKVQLSHGVRPGAYAIRDHDFRNPSFPLFGEASRAPAPEDKYEQYHYLPGAFLVESGKAGNTPVADAQGVARHDETAGKTLADNSLHADRTGKRLLTFETSVIDLVPGVLFTVDNHPHTEIVGEKLLVTDLTLEGTVEGDWNLSGKAVFADKPFRPPMVTPKPQLQSVECAIVVGPAGQEIHTDEFGRVRVQFPWDREGKFDDQSSCWMRVSQGWAGMGFGMIHIPRIGQEVLVGFLGGNPDQPIIVGRVYNSKNQVPYKLPDHKTRSTWKSDSSLGGAGFNELMFEDLKGMELVYVQAQKNLRKLVKNDETITVGNNRQKLVKANETETTNLNRVEVTGVDRTEITDANRTYSIGGDLQKLVKGNETEKTDGSVTILIGQNQDIIVRQTRKERVEGDENVRIVGARSERVEKTQSLTVGKDQQEQVAGSHALDAGRQIHLKAGTSVVIEGAMDLTLRGPGGFIRIDPTGIAIQGTLVRINSGGAPGRGSGASPTQPDPAAVAVIEEPVKPEPDDVSKTGFAQ